MPRIPYPDPAQLGAQARAELERAPINLQRMLSGASEAVFSGFNTLAGAFYGPSELPATLREVAILRVAYLSDCSYERLHHVPLARHVGLDAAQIDAIISAQGDLTTLTPTQFAVLRLTDDIVLHARADDATLAAVREHLSDRQLLDLIMVVGLYRTVAAVIETTGIEHDAQEIDWGALPSAQ